MGSGCPVSGCLLDCFLSLVRLIVVGSVFCPCAIYILMFFMCIPIFTVCLRLQTLKIVIYYCVLCNFLACPRFPWVPVASVSFLCIVYNCIYCTTVHETFPIVCFDSKTTM